MDTPNLQPLCQCGCGQPAPIAPRTVSRLGYFKGQPLRFIKGHNRRIPLPALLHSGNVQNEPRDGVWYRREIAELEATASHLEREAGRLRDQIKCRVTVEAMKGWREVTATAQRMRKQQAAMEKALTRLEGANKVNPMEKLRAQA